MLFNGENFKAGGIEEFVSYTVAKMTYLRDLNLYKTWSWKIFLAQLDKWNI